MFIQHLLLSITLLTPLLTADSRSSMPNRQKVDHMTVRVMVFGTPHLSRHDFEETPIDVEKIVASLSHYEPDLVVVEWLHPSLNPDDVPWYKKSYGDKTTLARLWGYKEEYVDSTLEIAISTLQNLKSLQLSASQVRLEMGKLYYLKSDLINAAYQWWRAEEEGENVTDLKRLTRNNFMKNEIHRYGFAIARDQDHEYLTSFDYHDWDAAWLGGRIWSEVRKKAINDVDGITEGDEGWKEAKDTFNKVYRAWSDEGDQTWIKKYGHIKEVREYVDHFMLDWRKVSKKEEVIENRNGLGLMRYYQSDAFLAQQRKLYYDGMTQVSIQGLGMKNVENFEVRNKHMVDFMEADVKRLGSKRVLIIVGSGHKLFLENELRIRSYEIVQSLDFMPNNDH